MIQKLNQMPKINYRYAREGDCDDLMNFALNATSESDLPQFCVDIGEELVARLYSKESSTILVAIDDDDYGEIVGYIEIRKSRKKKKGGLTIEGIYVNPNRRGFGIGKSLVNKVFEDQADDNVKVIVNMKNMNELRFWEEMGFKSTEYVLTRKI